jgi:hypothetical protein
MRFRHWIVSSLLIALAPGVAAEGIDWSKWYAAGGGGFGLNAKFSRNGQTFDFDQGLGGDAATDKSALVSYNVNGGIQLDPKTLLGVSVAQVAKTGKVAGEDSRVTISNYFILLTHFPREKGFFVRGGGGYANMVVNDGVNPQVRTGGAGLQIGAGWAWQIVSEHHFVTASVDQSFQWYTSSENGKPKRSEFSAAYIGYMYRH